MLVTDLIKEIRQQVKLLMEDDEMARLFWLAEGAKKLPSEFAEVGVYQGGSARAICEAKGDKVLHLFDTFWGLPEVDPTIDGGLYQELYKADLEQVKTYLANYNNIHFHKGLFQVVAWSADNLSRMHFAFVHLDVDLYSSMMQCLLFFYSRMEKGGIILIHDYPTTPGIKKAVDDFFNIKPEPPLRIAEKQCLIVKQ